ncbi:Site-specific recombinase XerD [Geodermatophilus amargosae]|uniref:Site-specific recombinase XerD n=1 Tax=Geodermatophilus amargosae TaxID=1296565 RepID=A0A1I6ZDY7_9ACTN|nr:Site-specific recombinase XerD [Geodermatophilus amargosae]
MAGSIAALKTSDGTTRYRARYRDPSGRQHERRFARKIDARRWLEEATSALVTHTWTAPERGRVTVAVWAEQWLSAQVGLKPSSRQRYASLLRAHILPTWGAHRLADVRHADVATWVARTLECGFAPATVRQAHRVLSLLLDLAVRDGRIPRNPAQRVPLPRVTRDEPRFLTRDEVERLADAAGEDGDIIRLLAYTGLRFGEMAALRVRRVDFLRRRLTIAESVTEVAGQAVFGTPKTHQQRTVPLPELLVDTLSQRCAGKHRDDFLLTTSSGTVLRLRNWRRLVFDPAVRAVGLTDVTPHDLRHTAASLAVASGASVKAVQRMLGHASAAMTLDVYSGLFDDDLSDLAARMDAAAREAASARVGAVWAQPSSGQAPGRKTAARHGGPRGDRTHNPRIKSPLLCQLS